MKNNTARTFFILILLIAALSGSALYLRSMPRHYTVGIVNPNAGLAHVIDGFKAGLAEKGLVEGENITYLYNGPLGSNDEIEPLIRDLLLKDPDLLFTITTPATLKAKKMTAAAETPVVFNTYSAIKSGVVNSLVAHGSHMTGVQIEGSTEKALEWLLLAAPDIPRIFVPVSFDTKAAGQSLTALRKGAEKLDVELLIADVSSLDELFTSLDTHLREADALFILNSILVVSNIHAVLEASIARNVPVGSGTEQYKWGAHITYAHNHFRVGEQTAGVAYKILKGTDPADLPVETADFFLGINLKTASAVGLKIPDSIITQADFIITDRD